LNSFRTFMYCDQRSQYIRPNSKKNSFRGHSMRKYGQLKTFRIMIFARFLGS
jgi:hypothetical protein